MTVSTEQILKKVVDLEALNEVISALAPEERVRVSKLIAAQLLEHAAFEMAASNSAQDVAELIITAAGLHSAHKSGHDKSNAHRNCAEN